MHWLIKEIEKEIKVLLDEAESISLESPHSDEIVLITYFFASQRRQIKELFIYVHHYLYHGKTDQTSVDRYWREQVSAT